MSFDLRKVLFIEFKEFLVVKIRRLKRKVSFKSDLLSVRGFPEKDGRLIGFKSREEIRETCRALELKEARGSCPSNFEVKPTFIVN